jgi:hypothetical protein
LARGRSKLLLGLAASLPLAVDASATVLPAGRHASTRTPHARRPPGLTRSQITTALDVDANSNSPQSLRLVQQLSIEAFEEGSRLRGRE